MSTDLENKELENKVRDIWNDANRYQQTRNEVRYAISGKIREPDAVPFYRHRIFAIAASILLIIGISAVFFLIIKKSPSPSENEIFTKGADSINQLKMDKPDSKARLHIYQKEIRLQWGVSYDSTSHLVIINLTDGKVAFQTDIKSRQTSFSLPSGTLRPGEYEWFVGNENNKKRLTIGKD